MSHPLHKTLDALIDVARDACDPWWIIGGAATALITNEFEDVHDVDILLTPADALQVIGRLNLRDATDGGTSKFRSKVYATWTSPPLPIDFLGGFQVHVDGEWKSVSPMTREALTTPFGAVYIPALKEHIEITRHFGRSRDLERVQRLRRLGRAW